MTMTQVSTLGFMDADSGDEATIIVRANPKIIGLALSLRKDGDIEVFFVRDECVKLRAALQQALSILDDPYDTSHNR